MTTARTTDLTTLAGVFFDMDGLLVDSEPQWYEVELDVMRRLGEAAWTPEQARSLVGNQLVVSAGIMAHAAGSAVPVEEIVPWFVDLMVARLEDHVPFKPGAVELLLALSEASVPTALVSSSHRRLLEPVLRRLPEDAFATSVAGDEVTHGKPHPEPYLLAASRLRLDPHRCVVLEDSPTGAAAGTAAGCLVVAVPDLKEVSPAPGRLVVPSLSQVSPALLDGWVAHHVDRG